MADDTMLQRHRRQRSGNPIPLGTLVDFVALDFETANRSKASICAVGITLVVDGEIRLADSFLVNPECTFDSFNSAINGLSERDVRDAPTLPDAWPTLMRVLDGANVCAHSARFDIGALRASAARYNLPCPAASIYCTRMIAQRVWPELPSFGLGVVAPSLGIDFNHHQAGDDAEACAKVALAAQRHVGANTLEGLAAAIQFRPSRLSQGSNQGLIVEVNEPDEGHPLSGRLLCFTGSLYSMTRDDAHAAVQSVGGDFRTSVSKKVDFLVIGDADFIGFADGQRTGKLTKAIELRDQGASVEIISESDFLALLAS